MSVDQAEACLLTCQECGREAVADMASKLCEACIRRHKDRMVRAMFQTVSNMRRWQQ